MTHETLAVSTENTVENTISFRDLGLDTTLQTSLDQAGYSTPTAIQQKAIPVILAGRDVMASAQTGTGKTAAFMLPALQLLTQPSPIQSAGPRILVLTPTRELAQQVSDAARRYGKQVRHAKVVSIVGGTDYRQQLRDLSRPFEILVATPGRLLDHMERGRMDFSRLQLLVLDEADRMLDMGFSEAVQAIADALPKERQTALFSATLEGVVGELADRLLTNPERIQIASARTKHAQIEQKLHFVDDESHKNKLLRHLIQDESVQQAIIFTATKRDADRLAEVLNDEGHQVGALHGDMSQRHRTRTLQQLRRGQLKLLVATDVAARGIDVQGITHVINYDLPKFAEDYVHRIGRTGRAGAQGIAISLAVVRERHLLSRIERFTGQAIPAEVIPGLEPKTPIYDKPRSGFKSRGGYGERDRGGYGGRGQGERGGYAGRGQGEQREGRGFYGDRNERQGYGDRPAAERGGYVGRSERPSYGDRPAGERGGYAGRSERPSYGDRPAGERGGYAGRNQGEQREGRGFYGDRNERPSYGDRNERGGYAGRPQGDRPFGERGGYAGRNQGEQRSFGDRAGGERGGYAGRGQGEQRSFGDRRLEDKPQVRSKSRFRPSGDVQ